MAEDKRKRKSGSRGKMKDSRFQDSMLQNSRIQDSRIQDTMLQNRAGFTLVELVVTLAVLTIVAAISVPALTRYYDRAGERQCEANRKALVAALESAQTANPDVTMAEILEENSDVVCPEGGAYTADGTQTVVCEIHGSSEAKKSETKVTVTIVSP